MTVLLYLPPCKVAEKLESLITHCLPQERVVSCHNIKSFSNELRDASSEIIGVVLIKTHQDLYEIMLLGDLLWNIRSILILPDSDPKTVAHGHAIRPRFLTFLDGDLNDVVKVLKRMIGTTTVPVI